MKRLQAITLIALVSTVLPVEPAYSTDGPARDASASKSGASSADIEALVTEAQNLFMMKRPIDARAKLQEAIQASPDDYRPYMMLGTYYLAEEAVFHVAYRYLKTAEKLFTKQFGPDDQISMDGTEWRNHARLLYLVSEAELNLDRYEDSLKTLDRFALKYWDEWYPGTRAWVLMKLKRVDEAIQVAQAGLIRGAEPGRTYNILGILLSVKDNRELSLEAFSKAIQSELAMGGSGQVATPLNNAGEVYREMFQDDLAEAAWVRATQLPDGCEHILPSLNLAILLTDEGRLRQAQRTLKDFEACFANNSARSDTEHRALLALQRGRLAMRSGDIDTSVTLLTQASEREQWFGKIGTNENDARFASTVSLAQALDAQAAALSDREAKGVSERLRIQSEIPWLRVRSWWLNRRAREIAMDELSDVEDLDIRHTDAILEYPTLGSAYAGFPVAAFRARIERHLKQDARKNAHTYYYLYLAQNLLEHGKDAEAEQLLVDALPTLRNIDRLARAEFLVTLALVRQERLGYFEGTFGGLSERQARINANIEEAFLIMPSHVRVHDLKLPVSFAETESNPNNAWLAKRIAKRLLGYRFVDNKAGHGWSPRFRMTVTIPPGTPPDAKKVAVQINFFDEKATADTPSRNLNFVKELAADGSDYPDVINEFIDKVFAHRDDPEPEPTRRLDILGGMM